MADLIRWEDNDRGGYLGYAGTLDDWFCQIWRPGLSDDEWVLQRAAMAGRVGKVCRGSDPDELKARAEELLREFASSVGAVFPDDLGERFWRDDERRRIQTVATANARDDCIALLRDKADEVGREPDLLRARMYRDAADLIRGDDQ